MQNNSSDAFGICRALIRDITGMSADELALRVYNKIEILKSI